MGYQHRLYTAVCGRCGSTWLLHPHKWNNKTELPRTFRCSCGAENKTAAPKLTPNVPRELHCGHDRRHQLRVYPYPLECEDRGWAMPYCVRSFVWQASKQLGGCGYDCNVKGELFNEPVISDICDSDDYSWESGHRCHTLAGFTIGESGCPLFEKLRELCQTMSEQRFLWAYLSLVKGRNFPMILPQVRIGIDR